MPSLFYVPDVQQGAVSAGVTALLTLLDPGKDSTLQEAGLDSLCKLATSPESRQHLIDKV